MTLIIDMVGVLVKNARYHSKGMKPHDGAYKKDCHRQQ